MSRRKNKKVRVGKGYEAEIEKPANPPPDGSTPPLRLHSKANPVKEAFRLFAHTTSNVVGSAWAFLLAVVIIIVWAFTGPIFDYSDTWQLVINTGTTIITFLMVFLIQNTQNRDARAIHLKLDELLRALETARTGLVNLEDLSDEELDELHKEFHALCAERGVPIKT